MKNVVVSMAFLLMVCVAMVPVPAWADSEQTVDPSVQTSDVAVVGDNSDSIDVGASSVPDGTNVVDEPIASPTPEPVTNAGETDANGVTGVGRDEVLATSEPETMDEWQVLELVTESESESTIWEKPFDEYTPTEGYLFLLFVLALVCVMFRIFKGGII